jgi:hypothetical protein
MTTMMMDEKLMRLRAHRDNMRRYRRLLKTNLTELERRFIERRLSEEKNAMEVVAASTFPVGLKIRPPVSMEVAA